MELHIESDAMLEQQAVWTKPVHCRSGRQCGQTIASPDTSARAVPWASRRRHMRLRASGAHRPTSRVNGRAGRTPAGAAHGESMQEVRVRCRARPAGAAVRTSARLRAGSGERPPAASRQHVLPTPAPRACSRMRLRGPAAAPPNPWRSAAPLPGAGRRGRE